MLLDLSKGTVFVVKDVKESHLEQVFANIRGGGEILVLSSRFQMHYVGSGIPVQNWNVLSF